MELAKIGGIPADCCDVLLSEANLQSARRGQYCYDT